MSGPVWAASYEDIYGTVNDPIENICGGYSSYSGSNLQPGANLNDADLHYARMNTAWLYSADLTQASKWSAATWTGAKYSLNGLDNNGNPIADTIFPTGMDQAWRDAAGMVAMPRRTAEPQSGYSYYCHFDARYQS